MGPTRDNSSGAADRYRRATCAKSLGMVQRFTTVRDAAR